MEVDAESRIENSDVGTASAESSSPDTFTTPEDIHDHQINRSSIPDDASHSSPINSESKDSARGESVSVQAVMEQYAVDQGHARHVARLALTLFDALEELHDLSRKTRHLLEVSALLHNIGLASGARDHQFVGRDIVLMTDLAGIDADDRIVVACVIAFHHKKVRPETEPAFLALPKKQRTTALWLAALLRVADGLDHSDTQTTYISTCMVSGAEVVLQLTGPHAAQDGAQAIEQADVWRKEMHLSLTIMPPSDNGADEDVSSIPQQSKTATDVRSAPQPKPLLTSETLFAEVCLLLLRRNFHKMLAQERGVRKDTDPDAIHDMRVATRRLRALLSVIEPVAPAKSIRPFQKEMRRIAHALGDVRDRDVFLADVMRASAHMDVDGEADPQAASLAPLVTALRHDREVASDHLLRELDSSRYDDFKSAFATFITDPTTPFDRTVRLRDLVGSRIWHRYETLRSHEVAVPPHHTGNIDSKALHRTRIAGKHLRYLLEVIEDLPEVQIEPVIDPLVELQDKFGAFQDIVVARDYIEALEVDDEARTPLNTYLSNRETKREHILADALRIWDEVLSTSYRHKLMEIILKL